MDLKTLEGKILANQSSIRQIRQCFPPPTFRAIRYIKYIVYKHYYSQTPVSLSTVVLNSRDW